MLVQARLEPGAVISLQVDFVVMMITERFKMEWDGLLVGRGIIGFSCSVASSCRES